MQTVEKINQISSVPQEEEFTEPENPVLDIHFSWALFQIMVCVLAIAALIAVKEFAPDIYNLSIDKYQSLMSADLFTEGRNIVIVDEE